MEQLEDKSFPGLIPLQEHKHFHGGVLSWLSEAAGNSKPLIPSWNWDIQVLEKVMKTAENMEKEHFPPAKFPGAAGWEPKILGKINIQVCHYPAQVDLGFGKQRENLNLPPFLLFHVLGSRIPALGSRTNFPTFPIKRFPSEPLIRTFQSTSQALGFPKYNY